MSDANKKFSELATVEYKESLLVPAVDLSLPDGQKNVNLLASSFGSSGSGGGVPVLSTMQVVLDTVSSEVNLGGASLVGIDIPAGWGETSPGVASPTPPSLSFQVAPTTGGFFRDKVDRFGSEYLIAINGAKHYDVPHGDFFGIQFIKLRSGNSAVPVPQIASRTLILYLVV